MDIEFIDIFRGESLAHTLAAVLQSPIDFEKLTAPAPNWTASLRK